MVTVLDPAQVGAHLVVAVEGVLDTASAPALRDRVLGLLNRGVDSLVVDLRGVSSIDSTGVGSLLRIHHRQALLGGSVHFVVDQPDVLHALDVMQLTNRLHVTPSVEDVDWCCAGAPARVICLEHPLRDVRIPSQDGGYAPRAAAAIG